MALARALIIGGTLVLRQADRIGKIRWNCPTVASDMGDLAHAQHQFEAGRSHGNNDEKDQERVHDTDLGLRSICDHRSDVDPVPRSTAQWLEKIGRSGGIRTHDPQSPRLMRYQTALRSDRVPG